MLDNILKLIGLFMVHWFIILVSSVYVLIRSSSKWDWVFFLVVGGSVLSWIFVKNECAVSLIEKRIIYNNYNVGDRPNEHPSMFMYYNNMYWVSIFGLFIKAFI